MKKISLLVLLMFYLGSAGFAQKSLEPWQYGHWLSADEMKMKLSPGSFVETPPPAGPIRNVAEFDGMQGALVRYPFGIPISLIKEMANDVMVTTIVANAGQQTTVTNLYLGAGVNLNHCNFLIAPSNSYWTRDFGPWFESDSANNIGIIDFPYNRPRPLDDEIPKLVATMLGIPWFGMNVTHTGGNYMTNGYGISSSTDLVWVENPAQTHAEIAQKMQNYLGINDYQVVADPNITTTIDHIDCWGKFLAPDKILIRKTPSSNACYTALENMATYWSNQVCSYGYNYQVFRVYTPQDQPYSNSLILNNKVFVPFMNSSWDDSAKAAYETAMPGYSVFGIIGEPSTPWISTDALHCRVMGLADVGLLYIRHIPLTGNQPAQDNFEINADLIPCSDSAVYNDSVLIWYKVGNGNFNMVHMINTSGYHFRGYIPKQPSGSIIKYYLYAADKSGRHAMAPFIGPADPFMFTAVYTDLTAIPDTLWFRNYDDCFKGKLLTIHNYAVNPVDLDFIEMSGIPQGGGCMWYVDSLQVTTFPHTMNPGDAVGMKVRFTFPVSMQIEGYVIDTLHFISAIDTHLVILMINDSLLTDIYNPRPGQQSFLGNNYPNPFHEMTTITYNHGKTDHVVIEILSVEGYKLKTLLNSLQSAGSHSVQWDGTNDRGNRVSPGIYFYRLISGDATVTRKLMVW